MVLAYEESCNLYYKHLFNEWKLEPVTLTNMKQGTTYHISGCCTSYKKLTEISSEGISMRVIS